MKATSEIIIDDRILYLLNIASSATFETLGKVVELLGIKYDEFQDFIAETHQGDDEIALEILNYLYSNVEKGTITSHSNGIGLQKGLERSLNNAFKKAKTTHALIIACNLYKNDAFSSLEYVRRDAEAIYSLLTQTYSNVDVNILVGSRATSDNIRIQLRELSKNVTEDDLVFIYFAGHVWTQKELDARPSYFCAYDSDLENLRKTAIAFTELRNITSKMLADRLLFVFDANLQTNLVSSLGMKDILDELGGAYQSLLSRSGEALIAINRKLKTQIEETSKHIRFYSSYFLNAMEGETRDIVRVRSLYYQIRKKVEEKKPDSSSEGDNVILLQYNSEEENFPIFKKQEG